MKERRRRLARQSKCSDSVGNLQPTFQEMLVRKHAIFEGFTTAKLEECLKVSTKNVARELVE